MAVHPRIRGAFSDYELVPTFDDVRPRVRPLDELHAERELAEAAAAGDQWLALEASARELDGVTPLERSRVVAALIHALRGGRLALVPAVAPARMYDHQAEVVDLMTLAGSSEVAATDRAATDEVERAFEVRLVDELGQPLAGVGVTFTHEGIEHPGATDGDGVARLEVAGISFASVSVTDREAVEAQLRERWAGVREGERIQPGDDVDVRFVRASAPITASLVATTPHTVSLQPDVRLVRLVGMHFDPHRSFLLPTALPNVRALAELYAEHPDHVLAVIGHAHPQEESSDAEALALERAHAVAAFLQDDVDAWLECYGAGVPAGRRWGGGEDSLMLRSLPDYPHKPQPEDTVRWFQRTRGLAVDGIAGPQTRTQLVAEYMAHDGTTLPVGASLRVHGCADHFPAPEAAPEHQAASDRHHGGEHRRVELCLFASPFGVLPEPAAETSGADATDYPQWCARAREWVDLAAEGTTRFVTLLEVADALFRTNSCVVAPEGEDPSADATHPSLVAPGLIATVLRYAADHPDKRLLVAGHCDTTGTAAFNQPLSEARAETTLALLLGQRDAFAARCHERHTVADYKQILSWVARAFEPGALAAPFDCDPGVIDDVAFTGIEPVRRFQAAYNANRSSIGASASALVEDGVVGEKTWGAMFDCYEHALRQELGVDAPALAARRSALGWVDDERKALGFSEHHPIDALGRDGYRSQANRRVEILLFDPGEEPNLDQAGGDPQMSEIYRPGRYERRHLDPLTADDLIEIRLCDPQGEPIAGAAYEVTVDGDLGTGAAGPDGFMRLYVPRTATSLVVEWSDPASPQPERATYSREVQLELDGGDEADHLRLRNLGYEGPLAQQLEAYRAEFARPAHRSDALLREEIRAWHDGAERPVVSQAAA